MGLIALFADSLDAIKVGDYKRAVRDAGRILVILGDDAGTPLALAVAPGSASEELSAADKYRAAEQFAHDIEATAYANEVLVRTGIASDASFQPGQWERLSAALVEAVRVLVPKPVGFAPVTIAPPVKLPEVLPVPGAPVAVPLDVPEFKPGAETPEEAAETEAPDEDEEDDAPAPPPPPPKKPKPKAQ